VSLGRYDAAGGDWPKKARDAALGREAAAEAESTSTMLLSDLRGMFAALATNEALFRDAHSQFPRRFDEELISAQAERDRAGSRHIAVYLNSPPIDRGRIGIMGKASTRRTWLST
jgi:Protein of unknown function (DUF3631)